MFITKKVFDPELAGKAVFLTTNKFDSSGFYIVSHVDNEDLHLVDHTAIVTKYHISFFDDEENDLQVLEMPEPKLKPLFNKVVVMEALPEIEFVDSEKGHKTGITREYQGPRNLRSDLQIKVDNAHIEYILRENIEPLKLEEITKRMQENHGHWHWTTKNASGFVTYAINCGKRIKKVGYGLYSYDWEAAE